MTIKEIETSIDVSVIDQYRYTDYDLLTINILEQKYIGRCFHGCLIKKILGIVPGRRSECRLTRNNLSATGSIDVTFTAEVLIISNGDYIHGCRIVHNNNGDSNQSITADGEYVSIHIESESIYNKLEKGQIIPCTALLAIHDVGERKISVLAKPLNLNTDETVFEVNDKLSTEDIAYFQPLLKNMNEVKKEYDSLKESKFMTDMLFPYKTENKYKDKIKAIKIEDIENLTGILTTARIDRSKGMIIQLKKSDNTRIDSAKRVVEHFLWEYINHLNNIIQMYKNYNTKKLIEEHSNLWSIYKDVRDTNI